jgi:hypothetical protein
LVSQRITMIPMRSPKAIPPRMPATMVPVAVFGPEVLSSWMGVIDAVDESDDSACGSDDVAGLSVEGEEDSTSTWVSPSDGCLGTDAEVMNGAGSTVVVVVGLKRNVMVNVRGVVVVAWLDCEVSSAIYAAADVVERPSTARVVEKVTASVTASEAASAGAMDSWLCSPAGPGTWPGASPGGNISGRMPGGEPVGRTQPSDEGMWVLLAAIVALDDDIVGK